MNTIQGLPKPPSTVASLLASIIPAFQAEVAKINASNLEPNEMRKARNRLFWGSRYGSKVEGIRDQAGVEQLFRRIIGHGPVRPARKDLEGNNLHCFALTHHYAGKGRTTYVRLSDLHEKNDLFVANVALGVDLDEQTGDDKLKLQAPQVHYLNSNIVTIVMSSDDSTFIDWYCGEPEKLYSIDNFNELVDQNGRLRTENLWIQLGIDFTSRSKEKRRRRHEADFQPQQKQVGKKHTPVPLHSITTVLDAALKTQEAETPTTS
jgi:hypothetical protein